jgi:hypothetical protein
MRSRGSFELFVLVSVPFWACAPSAPSLPEARFVNAPAVKIVDDRREVEKPPPRNREPYMHVDIYDAAFGRRVTRALEVPRPRRALGVSSIDEVPDSTWFTNRIGVRALTADEIRTGPVTLESPELHFPWTILSLNRGSGDHSFLVLDARGVKYLIKFDEPEMPELFTGTDVVVNRLLWAAGYNVAEDQVTYLRREDLTIAPGAKIKRPVDGDDLPLKVADVDEELTKVAREQDGRIRALASRWIDGKSLGKSLAEGVRDGDPNDLIPHEMRRDLRGAYSVFAWVDHMDLWAGNFLDIWGSDPIDPSRHYVKHYLVDFGKALSVIGVASGDRARTMRYRFDPWNMLRETAMLGIPSRPWDARSAPALRGVSPLFDAYSFDPAQWHSDFPYVPVKTADRIDKFWGAKIVSRFTRDQIHAAVEAARFTDPRAVEYITDTLVGRQRKTASYWFDQVNPLDRVAVEADGSVCFDDLAVSLGYRPGMTTRYEVASYDWAAKQLATPVVIHADVHGDTCTAPVAMGTSPVGYTIVRITTMRPGVRRTTFVHIGREPTTRVPRVIGLWRT